MIRRTRIVRGTAEAQRLVDSDELRPACCRWHAGGGAPGPCLIASPDELPAVLRAPVVVRRRDDAPVGPALVPVDLGAGDELRPVGRALPGHDLDARGGGR